MVFEPRAIVLLVRVLVVADPILADQAEPV